jgi:hypothetical protein
MHPKGLYFYFFFWGGWEDAEFFFKKLFFSMYSYQVPKHVSQAPIVFLNMFSIAPYFFLYDLPNVVLLEPNIGRQEYFYIQKFPKLENYFLIGQSKKLIVKFFLKINYELGRHPQLISKKSIISHNMSAIGGVTLQFYLESIFVFQKLNGYLGRSTFPFFMQFSILIGQSPPKKKKKPNRYL